MVVFVCNNCNESLKKPQVDNHLSWRCRGCSVSCLDCHRDFDQQSVKHHIKCVTEEERYSGGNFKPKVSTINGERKRNEWMELVQRVASQSSPTRPPQIQQLLNICASMQSVPAKQRAFMNYVENGQKKYANYAAIVWDILRKERDATMVNNSPSKPAKKQDQSAEKVVASPVKSEKKKKSKEGGENVDDTEEGKKKKIRKLVEDSKPDVEGTELSSIKKKKKKSVVSLEVEDENTPDTEETAVESKKKKKKSMTNAETADESTPDPGEISVESKKKKKKSVASEEESTAEVSVESKKKKKKSMVTTEPDNEGTTVDSKKNAKSDDVKQEEKQTLSRKQRKKQKKQERFKQQLALIEKDAGNDMEAEDETVGKKAKKSKKKKGTVNGNYVEKLQNGNSEEHEVESPSKKAKKRKAGMINGEDVDAEKKFRLNETLEESEASVSNGAKFQWKSAIEDILRSAKHNRLPLKKVRRKVLNSYAAQGGDPRDKSKSQDFLETKFSKMLAKMPNVKVENEKLELLVDTASGD